MGALGGMLGLSGGISGTGQEVTSGYTPEQRAAAYGGTQQAIQEQQRLLQALQAQGGIQNQQQIYQQLQDIVAGRGPNPAQAQLAAATGQNVAQQAALMAGQRGAGANVGLMARQAAGVGSQAQQQAAAQAAQLQAQQSLGALGAAGALAQQQAAQQMGATGALTQAQMAQQQMTQEELQRRNAIAGELAQTMMPIQQKAIGGLFSGLASALTPKAPIPGPAGAAGAAGAPGMADGGEVPKTAPKMSAVGRYMSGLGAEMAAPPAPMLAQGGSVGSALKAGGSVPGQAKVSGDSEKNDTVHALLSPGEVVIPRSVMQSSDPARSAAAFVQAVLAKKGMRS